MKRGFRFHETMAGSYSLCGEQSLSRPFSFTVEARAPSLLGHLISGKTLLTGTLEAEGFADGVALEGTLLLAPVLKRVIRYTFSFTANDGQSYRFEGQKSIRLLRLRESFTVLPGKIFDASGAEIATVTTRFDLESDLGAFIASWRPA